MPTIDNTVSLYVDKRKLSGWTGSRITVSLDHVPSDFQIELTDKDPLSASFISVEAGQSCQVLIGSDIVISGWIDLVGLSFSPDSHGIVIYGRSKCSDLVDCSITPDVLVGGQIFTSSILELAMRLCKPFNIPVAIGPGVNPAISAAGGQPAKINAVLTETPWEVIERVARYLGLLVYDMPDGSLMIANVGTATMGSGFAERINVQAAKVTYSMAERYSTYLPTLMSTNFMGQQGVGGMPFTPAFDKGVTRFRPLIVVSEQFVFGKPLAEQRAKWEAARRFGRSQAVVLTADNWRDNAGALWARNAFAPMSLPKLKLQPAAPWIIGTASFSKDVDRGTVADVILMPREAFQPEPTILTPFLYDPSVNPQPGGAASGGGADISDPTGGAPT